MDSMYAVVMAAGEGVRMKSSLPKVLHTICGKPMVSWALDTVSGAGAREVALVLSARDERTDAAVGGRATVILQDRTKYLGTGGAVMATMEWLRGKSGAVFVLAGDQPLVRPESFIRLGDILREGAAAAIQTTHMPDPRGYGRIRRDESGDFLGIVEQDDVTPVEACITEVSTSIYAFRIEDLLWALPQLKAHPPKNETYLTDVLGILVAAGKKVLTAPGGSEDGIGVNDRAQLAQATAAMRARINRGHMIGGVTLIDPTNTYIDADVSIGRDTVIYPGCVLEQGCVIGEGVTLLTGCHMRGAQVGDGTTVGPFAHLRPGTQVGAGCRIGDFVEIKNSRIGDGAKASHLSYIGDAEIGADSNIGCGVVFSNYDGFIKQRTTVGERAFIGCNVNLVAPVVVEDDAYIAAGSTVTEDVEAGALCIARCRQTVKPGWVAKRRSQQHERQRGQH